MSARDDDDEDVRKYSSQLGKGARTVQGTIHAVGAVKGTRAREKIIGSVAFIVCFFADAAAARPCGKCQIAPRY